MGWGAMQNVKTFYFFYVIYRFLRGSTQKGRFLKKVDDKIFLRGLAGKGVKIYQVGRMTKKIFF
jgi:hypothetical protein